MRNNVCVLVAIASALASGAVANAASPAENSGISPALAAADSLPFPQLGEGIDPVLTNKSRLVFWVDANKNCLDANTNLVTDAGGEVVQWADAREVFEDDATADPDAEPQLHAFAYKRGIVHRPAEGSTDVGGLPPTFKTDERHPGLRFLDFGDYGSGRWMYLANPGGEFMRQAVQSFYCVVGFDTPGNCGHILSDVASLSAKGSGTVFFHKGSGGSAAGPISCGTQDSSLFKGATYLDGARIDPRLVDYKYDRFQMFGYVGPLVVTNELIKSPMRPTFSTLLNDRNHQFGGGYRQGGAVIGELLVWNEELTEAERRHVEAYLRAKWFGVRTEPATAIAAGETHVVGDAGDSFLEAATGDGTLVKKGADTTTQLRHHLGDGGAAVRLEEGTLSVAGGRVDDLPVEPLPGTKVTLAEGRTTVSTEGAAADRAAFLGAAGQGVTVRPRDLAGKSIVAENTRLRILSPSAADFEDVSLAARWPNLLQDASFEEPDLGGDDKWTTVKSPWSGNGDSAEIATRGTWFNDPSPIPDGKQFLALQAVTKENRKQRGEVSQEFEAPIDGLYRLSFYMTRRTNRSEPANSTIALFSVDGTNFYRNAVADDSRGSRNVFKLYSAYLPPLGRGRHRLVLTVDDSDDTVTADRAVVLDDLRLTPVAAGEYVYVPNAGFDSGSVVPNHPEEGTGYYNRQMPEGWTCSAAEGAGEKGGYWGLTQSSSYWNWKNSREEVPLGDYRKVYLQYDGQMETTVTLPRAGRVRLSFTYANRSNSGYPDITGGSRPTGHRVVASLVNAEGESVEMAFADPVSPYVRTCQGVRELPAGDYTLRLRCDTRAQTADISVIVDDVRLVYEDSEARGLAARVPAEGRGAWEMASGATIGRDLESGAPEIRIPRGQWALQRVEVPSSGLYRVKLTMGGQQTSLQKLDGVTRGTSYYPIRLGFKVDGVVRGVYTLQDDDLVTVDLSLYLTEGVHALQVEAVTTGSAGNGMVRVTDLDLVPLTAGELPAKDETRETRLALTGDSRAELLYEGDLFVRSFSVDGKAYVGTLSRETNGLATILDGPGRIVVVPRGTLLLMR